MPTGNVDGVEYVVPFLQAYPFPGWILMPPLGINSLANFTLEPGWSNPAFIRLFGSRDEFMVALGVF